MARQSITDGGISDKDLPSVSTSFISAATAVNRTKQIEKAAGYKNFACLAEIITIPLPYYTVTGSRNYAGQASAQVICRLHDPSSVHKGRKRAAFDHPLHQYHIVFPHHHFW